MPTTRVSPPAKSTKAAKIAAKGRQAHGGSVSSEGGGRSGGATPGLRRQVESLLRSKVTSQGQTTLPSGLRRALGVRPGVDEIEYVIEGDHAVIRRATPADLEEEDPALLGLLDLLERDIEENAAGRLTPMPRALFDRIRRLTVGVTVDPDEPIHGPVAL